MLMSKEHGRLRQDVDALLGSRPLDAI